jgi:hypothetical protein
MALWAKSSRIEQLVSFTGICGFIGAVSDLLTPVGNYTMYCLVGGSVILLVGLVLLKLRGFTSEATKGTLSFGGLLTAVSVAFLVMSPGPVEGSSNGAIASRFDWAAGVQEQLLGLTKQVEQIAQDTQQIAKATDQIAKHTESVLSLNFSRDNFARALDSEDATNIAMHCDRGYRADHYRLLTTQKARVSSERNFAQLQELKCFDVVSLCEPEKLRTMVTSLDDHRVETVCGVATVAMINEERAAVPKREAARKAEREAKFRKCVDDAGDDFVQEGYCHTLYNGRY